MGLVSAFRQSIHLSKHNGLTPTQIAQEWPAAVELQALECETPRIVAALSVRMRRQLLIMLVLKLVFYAADLANPWLVGMVSLEYVEPSKYYALITAAFLGCRFVMFSCQGLGDMTARLCGVAAMSSMTRWVFDRMMVLPLGLVNPGMITNLCVTEARAVSMGTHDSASEPTVTAESVLTPDPRHCRGRSQCYGVRSFLPHAHRYLLAHAALRCWSARVAYHGGPASAAGPACSTMAKETHPAGHRPQESSRGRSR